MYTNGLDVMRHEIWSLANSNLENEILQWCAQDFFLFEIELRLELPHLSKDAWKSAWRDLRSHASMVRKSVVFSD